MLSKPKITQKHQKIFGGLRPPNPPLGASPPNPHHLSLRSRYWSPPFQKKLATPLCLSSNPLTFLIESVTELQLTRSLLSAATFRRYPQPLLSAATFHCYFQSLLSAAIFSRYSQSLLSVATLSRYSQLLLSVATLSRYSQSLLSVATFSRYFPLLLSVVEMWMWPDHAQAKLP